MYRQHDVVLGLHLATAMLAGSQSSNSSSSSIPSVEIAPGVFLPMLTMGGVHLAAYPDQGNYTMWLNLGGECTHLHMPPVKLQALVVVLC